MLHHNVAVAFVNTTQTRVTREETAIVKELPSSDWSMGISLKHFLK